MAEAPANKQTIHAVAAAAGVSASTVSRVLNNRPGVKTRTKAAVLETIQKLNYTPNLTARELGLRQVTHVGLNTSQGNRRLTPFATVFREQLFGELYQQGLRFADISTGADGMPAETPDVMVLTGLLDDDPRVAHLLGRGVPFVVLGDVDNSHSVASDDYDGGRQAAEHLLRLNHKEVLVVTGGSGRARTAHFTTLGQAAFERERGFADALAAAGVPYGSERVVQGEFTTLGAFIGVSRALASGPAFSAVFALSDEMAEGAIAAVEEAGLRVPDDVSVVGYDDLPEIGETFTTVRQDIATFVTTTVDLIKEALERKPPRHVKLPVQLVVRGTTARRR